MESRVAGRIHTRIGLGALILVTTVLPMGLAGCPCGCSYAPPDANYTPQSVVIDDFNSDGVQDVAVSGFRRTSSNGGDGRQVAIVLQNRSAPGTFQTATDIAIPVAPLSMISANLDATGGVDLAIAGTDSAAGNVIVLAQATAPSTPLAAPIAVSNAVGSGVDLAVGDLNGDGLQDLAIADNSSGNRIVLLIQDAAAPGRFLAPAVLALNARPTAVAVGDLNGDGKADVVVTGTDSARTTGKLMLFFANPAQVGQYAPPVEIGIAADPSAVAIGRLNGDSLMDIAVTHNQPQSVSILLQSVTQSGTFSAPVSYPTLGYSVALALADFNGDGRLDLATANTLSGSVSVLLQSSTSGSFIPAVTYTLPTAPTDLAAGNLNGDNLPDLAVASGSRATILINTASSPGSFGAPVNIGQ